MTSARRLPTRRDAVANRERLLSGAEVYFADKGLDAPLHGLADFVGVGIGTLYRNFPHHSDLVEALYDRLVIRFDAIAAASQDQPTGWAAIESIVRSTVEILVQFPATQAVMRRQSNNNPEYTRQHQWASLIDQHLRRAQDEGAVRTDLTGADLATAILTLANLQYFPEDTRHEVSLRLVTLLLDGIRQPTGTLTPLPEPTITVKEHYALIHS